MNRITILFARWLPVFGILTHLGRKSGKVYQTPVNVFRAPNGFIVALTYSGRSEWVKNVIAAGGCELKTAGKKYQLSSPKVVQQFLLNLDVYSQLLRHADIRTTINLYTQAVSEQKRSPFEGRSNGAGIIGVKHTNEPTGHSWTCAKRKNPYFQLVDGGRYRIRTYDFHRVKMALYR